MAARGYPRAMPATRRPGSTTAWRRLRRYVLTRDQLTCQRCPTPHPLTTHDKSLPTHATLGHKPGHEWAIEGDSMDPEHYQAECARQNYSAGATFGNRRRGLNTSRSW